MFSAHKLPPWRCTAFLAMLNPNPNPPPPGREPSSRMNGEGRANRDGSHDYLQIILSWRLFKIASPGATQGLSPDTKALNWPTNDDINFTKNARMQIATLRKWRVPDACAGQ